jgi:NADPH2:quinone reductase
MAFRVVNYLQTADENYEYGRKVYDLVAQGVIKVTISKEYPFTREGVIQSQKDLTSGKTVGKLLIKVE